MGSMETVAPFAEIVEEIKKAGGEAFRLCYQCGKCDVVCPWNRVTQFSITFEPPPLESILTCCGYSPVRGDARVGVQRAQL